MDGLKPALRARRPRIDRKIQGVVVGGLVAMSPIAGTPLARFGSPFALLIVLPALALSLEAFGWSESVASVLRRLSHPLPRLLGAYALWLGTSAVLTLDVAAAAGPGVAVEIAGQKAAQRRWHLGAAMLGSNVGSLLFPFSNLTNLVLVGAAGIGLASFIETAWLPQLGAAFAVGILLVLRARRSGELDLDAASGGFDGVRPGLPADPHARAAGAIALLGAAGAIVIGLAGGDMAIPFALSGGAVAGTAVALGRIGPRDIARAIPYVALAIVVAAAVAAGPISTETHLVPQPSADLVGLAFAVFVGGLLAAAVNNLPAAAFGALWLSHAPVAVIVAYLIGTNVAAIATPHGSAATMLVRSGGAHHGARLPTADHLRTAWQYAVVGSAAALGFLAAAAR